MVFVSRRLSARRRDENGRKEGKKLGKRTEDRLYAGVSKGSKETVMKVPGRKHPEKQIFVIHKGH